MDAEFDYDGLLQLCRDDFTADLLQRQATTLHRLCRTLASGLPVKDLPSLQAVFRVAADKCESAGAVFESAFSSLLALLGQPYIRCRAGEERERTNAAALTEIVLTACEALFSTQTVVATTAAASVLAFASAVGWDQPRGTSGARATTATTTPALAAAADPSSAASSAWHFHGRLLRESGALHDLVDALRFHAGETLGAASGAAGGDASGSGGGGGPLSPLEATAAASLAATVSAARAAARRAPEVVLLLARLLRDLSEQPDNAPILVACRLPQLCVTLCDRFSNVKDPLVPLAVETLWNLCEHGSASALAPPPPWRPLLPAASGGDAEADGGTAPVHRLRSAHCATSALYAVGTVTHLAALGSLLHRLCATGNGTAEKELRNDVLAVLLTLARRPENLPPLAASGTLALVLQLCTAPEQGAAVQGPPASVSAGAGLPTIPPLHYATPSDADIEARTLLWGLVARIAHHAPRWLCAVTVAAAAAAERGGDAHHDDGLELRSGDQHQHTDGSGDGGSFGGDAAFMGADGTSATGSSVTRLRTRVDVSPLVAGTTSIPSSALAAVIAAAAAAGTTGRSPASFSAFFRLQPTPEACAGASCASLLLASPLIPSLLLHCDVRSARHNAYVAGLTPAQRRAFELQALGLLTALAPYFSEQFLSHDGCALLALYVRCYGPPALQPTMARQMDEAAAHGRLPATAPAAAAGRQQQQLVVARGSKQQRQAASQPPVVWEEEAEQEEEEQEVDDDGYGGGDGGGLVEVEVEADTEGAAGAPRSRVDAVKPLHLAGIGHAADAAGGGRTSPAALSPASGALSGPITGADDTGFGYADDDAPPPGSGSGGGLILPTTAATDGSGLGTTIGTGMDFSTDVVAAKGEPDATRVVAALRCLAAVCASGTRHPLEVEGLHRQASDGSGLATTSAAAAQTSTLGATVGAVGGGPRGATGIPATVARSAVTAAALASRGPPLAAIPNGSGPALGYSAVGSTLADVTAARAIALAAEEAEAAAGDTPGATAASSFLTTAGAPLSAAVAPLPPLSAPSASAPSTADTSDAAAVDSGVASSVALALRAARETAWMACNELGAVGVVADLSRLLQTCVNSASGGLPAAGATGVAFGATSSSGGGAAALSFSSSAVEEAALHLLAALTDDAAARQREALAAHLHHHDDDSHSDGGGALQRVIHRAAAVGGGDGGAALIGGGGIASASALAHPTPSPQEAAPLGSNQHRFRRAGGIAALAALLHASAEEARAGRLAEQAAARASSSSSSASGAPGSSPLSATASFASAAPLVAAVRCAVATCAASCDAFAAAGGLGALCDLYDAAASVESIAALALSALADIVHAASSPAAVAAHHRLQLRGNEDEEEGGSGGESKDAGGDGDEEEEVLGAGGRDTAGAVRHASPGADGGLVTSPAILEVLSAWRSSTTGLPLDRVLLHAWCREHARMGLSLGGRGAGSGDDSGDVSPLSSPVEGGAAPGAAFRTLRQALQVGRALTGEGDVDAACATSSLSSLSRANALAAAAARLATQPLAAHTAALDMRPFLYAAYASVVHVVHGGMTPLQRARALLAHAAAAAAAGAMGTAGGSVAGSSVAGSSLRGMSSFSIAPPPQAPSATLAAGLSTTSAGAAGPGSGVPHAERIWAVSIAEYPHRLVATAVADARARLAAVGVAPTPEDEADLAHLAEALATALHASGDRSALLHAAHAEEIVASQDRLVHTLLHANTEPPVTVPSPRVTKTASVGSFARTASANGSVLGGGGSIGGVGEERGGSTSPRSVSSQPRALRTGTGGGVSPRSVASGGSVLHSARTARTNRSSTSASSTVTHMTMDERKEMIQARSAMLSKSFIGYRMLSADGTSGAGGVSAGAQATANAGGGGGASSVVDGGLTVSLDMTTSTLHEVEGEDDEEYEIDSGVGSAPDSASGVARGDT